MRIDEENNLVQFSTGTTGYAFGGAVSIDSKLDLYEGFDGGFGEGGFATPLRKSTAPLTRKERIELADFMIARWEQFKRVKV